MSDSSSRMIQRIHHVLLLTMKLILAVFPFITEARLEATVNPSRRQDEQNELLMPSPTSLSSSTTQVFPTLDETLHLSYLSSLVYEFRHHISDDKPYCDVFNEYNNNKTSTSKTNPFQGVECIWYHVESSLGTQILILKNDIRKSLSVVYAGTDNVRTVLEDTNIAMMKFGNTNVHIPMNATSNDSDHDLDPDYYYDHVKIHAGFNHAVFTHDVYRQVEQQILNFFQQTHKWRPLHRIHKDYKLYISGHSLGAANAILTSVALSIRSKQHGNSELQKYLPKNITSINFGCPQTGNVDWRDYVNDILLNDFDDRTNHAAINAVDRSSDIVNSSSSSNNGSNVSLWRVVLGWDLVPRLPELFSHVGHTIQIWSKNHKTYDPKRSPNRVEAYYHHYGNDKLGYSGVPIGWSSKPYVWVPGAIGEHFITKYIDHLKELKEDEESIGEKLWVSNFQEIENNDDNDEVADDDFWVDPPDDYITDMNYDIYDMEDEGHKYNVQIE